MIPAPVRRSTAAPVLGVDLGKTGCRGELRGPAGTTRRDLPGAPGLAASGGVGVAAGAIARLVDDLVGPGSAVVVSVGAAGAQSAPDAARDLAARLLQRPDIVGVVVTSDAVTAHAGALGGEPGVVLAAGTGSVAVAVGEDGGHVRVDGWGPTLGDEGSGGWIGAEAVRAALRAHDGRGPGTALRDAVAEHLGVPLDGLPALLGGHEAPTRLLAGLVAVVAGLAAGDDVAADVIGRAADALAASALAAASAVRLGPRPACAVVGGLATVQPLCARLMPLLDGELDLRDPLGGPLDGAFLLAGSRDLPLEALVQRVDATY